MTLISLKKIKKTQKNYKLAIYKNFWKTRFCKEMVGKWILVFTTACAREPCRQPYREKKILLFLVSPFTIDMQLYGEHTLTR